MRYASAWISALPSVGDSFGMALIESLAAGTPIVVADPAGAHARVYRDIARLVWEGVEHERAEGGRPAPRIVIE